MSARSSSSGSRPPVLQIAALLALATAATIALSFQLGAARAFAEASQEAHFAAQLPVLAVRASALLESGGSSPQAKAELARLLDQIEATHAVLVLSATLPGWDELVREAREASPSSPDIDSALRALIGEGRAAAAAEGGALRRSPPDGQAEPQTLALAAGLERVAASYGIRQREIIRRQVRLAVVAWGGVIALSVFAAATMTLSLARRDPEERDEPALPRSAFMDRLSAGPLLEAPSAAERLPPSVLGRALVLAREEGLREALCDRLGALGLSVQTAATPAEAMEAVEIRRFGLFVVESASVAVARRLKAAAGPTRMSCVAVAFAGESARALRAAGADVVVTRPLLPMEIETAAAFAIGAIPARRKAA